MMAVPLAPADILGYGPIREDFEGGRLGLLWGKASAFADSPDKVTATSDAMARSMSVTMNVMDLVTGGAQRGRAVVARTSCPARWACRRSGSCAAAT